MFFKNLRLLIEARDKKIAELSEALAKAEATIKYNKANPVTVAGTVYVDRLVPVGQEITKVYEIDRKFYSSLDAVAALLKEAAYGKTVVHHYVLLAKDGTYYKLSGLQPITVE